MQKIHLGTYLMIINYEMLYTYYISADAGVCRVDRTVMTQELSYELR